MPKITVVGSISTDFVVTVNKRPKIGETIEGQSFATKFGGKGANQAVACSRLGAETHMIGAVGDDDFGERLLENLEENGISVNNVERVTHCSSGSAFITLSDGDNSIVYIPGANAELNKSTIEKAEKLVASSDIVLVQNETPKHIVETLIDLCHELTTPILLNPAPAREINEEFMDKVSFLTPNETEFSVLFPEKSVKEILEKYPNKLILTLGEKGAQYFDGKEMITVPSFKSNNVVDTTGAGDTFNGAFAYAYASGMVIEESIRFANLAASLSIQKEGAQIGSPTLNEMKGRNEFEKKWNT